MNSLEIITSDVVKEKFDSYPSNVLPQLLKLRELIIEVAQAHSEISSIEETLKWGEPSYLVKKGSTIRMDWKEKTPQQVALYFRCTSLILPTIKALYGPLFNYEGNRAILFNLQEKIPKKETKDCIEMALRYHTLKKKPLLGR